MFSTNREYKCSRSASASSAALTREALNHITTANNTVVSRATVATLYSGEYCFPPSHSSTTQPSRGGRTREANKRRRKTELLRLVPVRSRITSLFGAYNNNANAPHKKAPAVGTAM